MLSFFSAFYNNPTHSITAIIFFISLMFKAFLIGKFSFDLQTKKNKLLKKLLIFVLICECIADTTWILGRCSCFGITIPRSIYLFNNRIAWALYILQGTVLALLIESLAKKVNFKSFKTIFFTTVSTIWSLGFIVASIVKYGQPLSKTYPRLAIIIGRAEQLYICILLVLSITATLKFVKKQKLSKIATKQIYLFVSYFILPKMAIDVYLYISKTILPMPYIARHIAGCTSTLIMSWAMYYCIKKMLAVRFLNIKEHVEGPNNTNFSEHWSILTGKLAHVTKVHELKYIVAQFAKDAFNMKKYGASLYIRKIKPQAETPENINPEHAKATEAFLSAYYYHNKHNVASFMKLYKILIRDEIEFSNFYETSETYQACISFLDSIEADVFIPIYEKNIIIGYIIIDQCARKELYSLTNRNEFIILADYLGLHIKQLQQGDIKELIADKKQAEDEAFKKHQQINSFKETMHNLIIRNRDHKIGFINYQRGKFWYENKTAQELVPVDLNTEHGLPLTQQLHTCVKQALQYKTIQTNEVTGHNGEKLTVTLLPGSSESSCTLSISRPVISDSLMQAIEQIHDPSHMDYRLYLETTQSGKLVDAALPGSNQTLIRFKMNLLELALTKKAVVLNMVEPDLDAAAHVLHEISLRTALKTVELTEPEQDFATAIKLFGINPLLMFKNPGETTKGLLESLHNIGTIFIKNVEYLHLETQEYLAEYLRYGSFKEFRSERSIESSVRIICSTNQDLHALAEEGKFSMALLNELKHTTLTMPSLLRLPQYEVEELTDELAETFIANKEFRSALKLSNHEKRRIIKERLLSVHELKERILKQLREKAQYHEISHVAKISTEEAAHDPVVLKAARLGKHALKDRQLMIDLWGKFQSQTKIADLLGVNRSSVNRRLKSFNIF